MVKKHSLTRATAAQAEEERVAAEEAAAAAEAEALAANPVLRLRKLAQAGAEPRELLAELKGVEVEGGQIGRTRVLYEARALLHAVLRVSHVCNS